MSVQQDEPTNAEVLRFVAAFSFFLRVCRNTVACLDYSDNFAMLCSVSDGRAASCFSAKGKEKGEGA